ncbi:MAG: hypothetical protein HFJ06_01875 [Lachnospiraceae bacterium]|nr:hypothetical protein [Lachnospiraceae bacterium]
MSKYREEFKAYVMRYSYQARRKRKLDSFNKEIKRLRAMDKDELDFEYIEFKTELDHKKNVLSLFLISIALSVLMNVWSKFFSFMHTAFQYAATSSDSSEEIMKISFILSALMSIVITLVILFLLFDLSKEMMIAQKELMIIENVRKEK